MICRITQAYKDAPIEELLIWEPSVTPEMATEVNPYPRRYAKVSDYPNNPVPVFEVVKGEAAK